MKNFTQNQNAFFFVKGKLFIVLVFLLIANVIFPVTSYAQGIPNEAEWNGGGYSLKKIVSNTSIQSGVNFSYTILFSAPAGATTVNIQDAIPASLVVVNVPTPSPVNGITPSVSITGTPGVNEVVSYSLTSLPSGSASSGSFTIVVKFPEGVTCDGTSARNRAGILTDDWHYTPYVSTTAIAEDPWKVTKSIISGAVVNPGGGSCGYLIEPGDTVTYRLSVLKKSPFYGNVIGQLNMTSAVVTDVLPAGAVMLTSTCGIPPNSTGTITWMPNSGTLNAATPYAYYYCDITVYYPAVSFPVGSFIYNEISLDGIICNQPATQTSNETCIEVANIVANPNGYFNKSIYLTNRVPGCQGFYRVAFCNTGNVALSAFNIDDVIPAGVSVNQVKVYGGNATTTMALFANSGANTISSSITSNYFDSGTIGFTVNDLQLQMTGSLPVGKCIYMYIYFDVEPNPTGTVVTNCADFDGLSNSLTLPQACVSFTVDEGEPRPCVLKDVCSPQSSYDPGDIIRFRIRVQNIGSADISGAIFQDNLHSNFTYVGNESYYIANSYNPTCSSGGGIPAGTTTWPGVIPNHTGNNLEWTLPDIPSDCQLFYVGYCGYYGTWGLPYYFVEFDVMVDSMAMPGVTPNNYEISGGNLGGTVTSNTTYSLVVASFGQEVEKQVSSDNGANYSSSATVAAGGTARYRLNYKNTSNVSVSSVKLVDLLPMNDASPNDWLVLNRTISRGSQFGVTYNSNHNTSVSAGTVPTSTLNYSPGLNLCLPTFGVTASCVGSPVWSGTVDQNMLVNYGSFLLNSNITVREDFDVIVPPGTQNLLTACNDFAAISTADFLLDGVPQVVALTPIAAPPVCISVDSVSTSCCDSIRIEQVSDPTGADECCIRISTDCEVKAINVLVNNAVLGSVSWNCGNLPTGYAGQSDYTFAANNCALDMIACFDSIQGPVSVTYIIDFQNGERCEKTFDLECVTVTDSCCENIKVDVFQDPDLQNECCAQIVTDCEVDSILVNITNGTFSSASWNCGNLPTGFVGQSSFTFDTNLCVVNMITCVEPDQTGIVVIDYIIYLQNGEVCEKSIELDCVVTDKNCCDSVDVRQVVNADGTLECCTELITKCEVDSINVSISNGTFSSNSWNCQTTIPTAAIGQSSYTFISSGCTVDMINCINADQTGIVVINYIIYFSNGEVCEKSIELDCEKETSDCCPIIDFKLKQKWPHFSTQVGTFSITNPDPSSPICSVVINAAPGGTFTTGNLIVDGVASGQAWNPMSIPASGSLSPSAANTLVFSLVGTNYKGTISICIIKCDGTECCYEFKWNKKPWIDIDISHEQLSATGKLFAVTINPKVTTEFDGGVKYVSFGMRDEQEVAEESAAFFAISASAFEGDEYPEEIAAPVAAYMSKHNSFFELADTKSAGEDLGAFNLVFRKMVPMLGCTLFDDEGNIVYSGNINVSISDTLNTSAIETGEVDGDMFEFINLYPNPSDGNFNVTFANGSQRDIEIRVINPMGQVVQILESENRLPGIHNVNVRTNDFSSGLYKVVLYSEGQIKSKSAVLNR